MDLAHLVQWNAVKCLREYSFKAGEAVVIVGMSVLFCTYPAPLNGIEYGIKL